MATDPIDITTGVLKTSFAPRLNGQVKAVALSTDTKTLYVVGAFTRVGTIRWPPWP